MYPLLNGIRIIDFTTTYLGPYATQFLGDMGADVTKVEPPGGGVVVVLPLPPQPPAPRSVCEQHSALPAPRPDIGQPLKSTTRNTRTLAVDPRPPEGRAIAAKLIAG